MDDRQFINRLTKVVDLAKTLAAKAFEEQYPKLSYNVTLQYLDEIPTFKDNSVQDYSITIQCSSEQTGQYYDSYFLISDLLKQLGSNKS